MLEKRLSGDEISDEDGEGRIDLKFLLHIHPFILLCRENSQILVPIIFFYILFNRHRLIQVPYCIPRAGQILSTAYSPKSFKISTKDFCGR